MKIYKRILFSILLLLPFSLLADECFIAEDEVRINGLTIAYSHAEASVGYDADPSAETILLLHGLFASKAQWNKIICALAEHDYNVIAPDLPGYGDSTSYALRDYQLERQAELLHKFITKLNIEKLHIAGGSMGGTIAALFAEDYPEKTSSLAFLGAPLGIISYNEPLKKIMATGVNPFIPVHQREFAIEMNLLFAHPPTVPPEVIQQKIGEYTVNNKHYVRVWNIVNLYQHILQQEFSFSQPVFIAWGEKDKIFAIDNGMTRLQQSFPNTSAVATVVIEDSGHLPEHDHPGELSKKYLDFLSEAKK